MAVLFNRAMPRKATTQDYNPTEWANGGYIQEGQLNNLEAGVLRATRGVQALEAPEIEVNTLEAGEQATASYEGGKFTFNVPKGDKGERGLQGAQGPAGRDGAAGPAGPAGAAGQKGEKGEAGAAGAAGKNGNMIRISSQNVTVGENNQIEHLTPNNERRAIAVGDLVLHPTSKKLYEITAVNGTKYTASNELGTLG